MIRSVSCILAAVAAAGTALVAASPAWADGYPPFYGYSPYLGRPTVYFTPDSDVQQATTSRDGGFDVRTYYRGGPFWTYEAVGARRAVRKTVRSRRHMAILRRRG